MERYSGGNKFQVPERCGFAWERKLFGDGKPRAPWDFVRMEDEEFLRYDQVELSDEIRIAKILGEVKKEPVRFISVFEVMPFRDDAYVVLAKRWGELEEMELNLHAYAKGEGNKQPFCNPLGAPIRAVKKRMVPVEVGRIGMALIKQTGKYYRVKIMETSHGTNEGVASPKAGTCKVRLLDYGGILTVEAGEIFYLPHRFVQLPFVGIRLILRNGRGAFQLLSQAVSVSFERKGPEKGVFEHFSEVCKRKQVDILGKYTSIDQVVTMQLGVNRRESNIFLGDDKDITGIVLVPEEFVQKEVLIDDDGSNPEVFLATVIRCLQEWYR